MRTTFRMKESYAKMFLACAMNAECKSSVKPIRFMEKMKNNTGTIAMLSGKGLDDDGLERRNPIIVALGDSVTAGHFEIVTPDDPEEQKALSEQYMLALQGKAEMPIVEITDARESYIEKFREKLIELYETTSVSVVNAGIAGDNLIQMVKRTERDVISLRPDLVLINGALNWDEGTMGSTEDYKELLRTLVKEIRSKTEADIILLTPNGDLPSQMLAEMGITVPEKTTTLERVIAIREIAEEEQICLADVYAVWEDMRDKGCDWKELLANGVNHPSVEGHEVYAITLMKLFEES